MTGLGLWLVAMPIPIEDAVTKTQIAGTLRRVLGECHHV